MLGRDHIVCPYLLSRDVHLPVKVRVSSLDLSDALASLPHPQHTSRTTEYTPAEFVVSLQLCSRHGPLHSDPQKTLIGCCNGGRGDGKNRTNSNAGSDVVRFDEWITFPCSYSALEAESFLRIKVWGVGDSLLFTAELNLFDTRGRLCQGRQRISITATTISEINRRINRFKTKATADQPFVTPEDQQQLRLQTVLERYARGSVPKLDWLDRAIYDTIRSRPSVTRTDNTPHTSSSSSSANHQQLLDLRKLKRFSSPAIALELPSFEYHILFEIGSYVPTTNKLSDTHGSAASARVLASLGATSEKQAWWEKGGPGAIVDPEIGLGPSRVHDNNAFELERGNPAELKYHKLARSILRGLSDVNLKPNKHERTRIEQVLGSPNPVKGDEQNLLWKFRYSLLNDKRALTKLVCCVDWRDEQDEKQAAELLAQWKQFDVTDALRLLSGEPEFRHRVVRSFAIRALSQATDDELSLFLLQLVQALRHDAEMLDGEGAAFFAGAVTDPAHDDNSLGPLALFLVERASDNRELATFFHWYLVVEMGANAVGIDGEAAVNVSIGVKGSGTAAGSGSAPHTMLYVRVYRWFMERMSQCPDGEIGGRTVAQALNVERAFVDQVFQVSRTVNTSRKERVDKRDQKLKAMLQTGGAYVGLCHLKNPIALPLHPEILVNGVRSSTARIIPSATYPLVVELRLSQDASTSAATAGGNASSVKTDSTGSPAHRRENRELLALSSSGNYYKVMFKDGDDLRQDQLVLQMVGLMDRLFKLVNLDLNLTLYRVLPTSKEQGLMEFVESMPISKVLKEYKDIRSFFRAHNPAPKSNESNNGSISSEDGIAPGVLTRFIKSCAGYSVITYVLGIGDRHLDNIMLRKTGQLFHLDFGYIFGRDPKPWPVPMRITKEMIDGMGGRDSDGFRKFKSHCCQAYKVLRGHVALILDLVQLMTDAEIPDLSINQDPVSVLLKIQDKFQLHLSDEEAETLLLRLIDQSVDAFSPVIMDFFHGVAQSRR